MGSGKQDPTLFEDGNPLFRLRQQNFTRVLFAFTLSIALAQLGAQAQQSDNKKTGLDPVAASSPATSSKSAMGELPGKTTSAQNLPKPDSAKTGTGAKTADSKQDAAADKSTLPFPIISNDNLNTVGGVQSVNTGRNFPSAIDIHGSPSGVLLHALKDTRYDLLSPLSIWLEEGPLLVSVRRPSDMVLVATKFGDVCVLAGGDALVERGENDTLRIVNLCTNSDTVFLNMHDKLWMSSPWGHAGKLQSLNHKKSKKKQTYDGIESGAVSIAPAYELLIGNELLSIEDVKPPDSIGRRDFKSFEGGKFVVSEISIEHLTQIHELIKNLNSHGEKASSIFSEIMKNAGTLKAKQGDTGFEKNVPPPPKPVEPKRKPPTKAPPKSNVAPPAAAPSGQKPPASGSSAPASNSTKPTSTVNPAPASAPPKK